MCKFFRHKGFYCYIKQLSDVSFSNTFERPFAIVFAKGLIFLPCCTQTILNKESWMNSLLIPAIFVREGKQI